MINLYTVDTPREIIGMNINGPLTTPTPMEYHNVLKMVKAGYTVYQHNPFNLNEKVKVTVKNINNIKMSITSALNKEHTKEIASMASSVNSQQTSKVDVIHKDNEQTDTDKNVGNTSNNSDNGNMDIRNTINKKQDFKKK